MQFDQLKRREFITLLAGTAAWPFSVHAQEAQRIRRVGVIIGASESDQTWYEAFRRSLQQLGWIEGRNVRLTLGSARPSARSWLANLRRNYSRFRRT